MPEITDSFDEAMAAQGKALRLAEQLDETLLPTSMLARWVWAVRGAVKRLRIVDGEASHALSIVLDPGKPTVIDGVVWEPTTSYSRTEWDNDAVRREVMKTARFDPKTGEARDADDALSVVSRLYPLGGSGLRLTAARELIPGFDPDEFSHTERRRTAKATESAPSKEEQGGE